MKNKSGREMFERNEFVIFLIIKILKFLPKSILIFFGIVQLIILRSFLLV